MATIIDNPKYGDGHQIVLKEKLSASISEKFLKFKYRKGAVFSIYTKQDIPKDTPVINLLTGDKIIFLKDESNNVIKLQGSASSINGSFNHYSQNAKSNTNILTEIKETISMEIFKEWIENKKILSEEKCVDISNKIQNGLYDTLYYDSAIKQLEALKPIIKANSGYTYERQGIDKTKRLYEVARRLSKKSNDNWNPADVWLIRKSYKMDQLYASKNITELNSMIALAWKNMDLIPISLKQITKPKASFSVIDPDNMMNMNLDIDLNFAKVDLSDTFANFILETKSGFSVRCGFKASATTLNVSLEGRFKGAGYQLGAIDAKTFGPHIRSKYSYVVRSGVGMTSGSGIQIAKKELKSVFAKYKRISNTISNYAEAEALLEVASDLTKKRFVNLISYLYALTVAPRNVRDFIETMKFCYFSSKKITADSCLYVILN